MTPLLIDACLAGSVDSLYWSIDKTCPFFDATSFSLVDDASIDRRTQSVDFVGPGFHCDLHCSTNDWIRINRSTAIVESARHDFLHSFNRRERWRYSTNIERFQSGWKAAVRSLALSLSIVYSSSVCLDVESSASPSPAIWPSVLWKSKFTVQGMSWCF